MALLDVKNLTKNFGGLTAVSDVTLELNEGLALMVQEKRLFSTF
mgnify:CR=1 FL=1